MKSILFFNRFYVIDRRKYTYQNYYENPYFYIINTEFGELRIMNVIERSEKLICCYDLAKIIGYIDAKSAILTKIPKQHTVLFHDIIKKCNLDDKYEYEFKFCELYEQYFGMVGLYNFFGKSLDMINIAILLKQLDMTNIDSLSID